FQTPAGTLRSGHDRQVDWLPESRLEFVAEARADVLDRKDIRRACRREPAPNGRGKNCERQGAEMRHGSHLAGPGARQTDTASTNGGCRRFTCDVLAERSSLVAVGQGAYRPRAAFHDPSPRERR